MDQLKVKTSGLVFCGEDELTAKDEVNRIKAGGDRCVMLSGLMEIDEAQTPEWVIIMPDVPGFRAEAIRKFYGDKVIQEETVSTDDGTLEPARRRPGRPRKTPAPILANIE